MIGQDNQVLSLKQEGDMEMHPIAHTGVADWIPFLIVFFLGLLYPYGYLRLREAGRIWKKRRAGSFLIGIMLLGVAFFPDFMQWAHHSIKGHMVQHILVGMIAPIFLVLRAKKKTCFISS